MMGNGIYNKFNTLALGLGFGFMASTWWLGDDPDIVIGSIFLGGLWVVVFNFLPVVGWNCLKDNTVKYFFIPVSSISTVLYLFGVYHVYS